MIEKPQLMKYTFSFFINLGISRPKRRRKDFGKRLIEDMLKDCGKQGCHKARLEVFADNHKAISSFKHLGFIQEGYLGKDEEKKDIVIMSQKSFLIARAHTDEICWKQMVKSRTLSGC